jgi:predicted dehydrogenase
MSKIRLAFIGCGGMAGAHLRAYLELKRKGMDIFDIVALADPVEEQTAKFAEMIGGIQTSPEVKRYADYEKMLDEQKPDAADICTPHHLHHVHAIACFESGVHAIVEKPLGVTVKAAQKMIKSADEHGKMLAVAEQVRRWLPSRAVAWAIHSGMIGDPRMFFSQITGGAKIDPENLTRDRQLSWRQIKLTGGGGPIFDFGVHYIDLLMYFFGEVDSVCAYADRMSELKYKDSDGNIALPTVEDTSIAHIKFKNGVVGTWNWSGIAPGKSLSYTIYYGSKGSVYSGGVYPNNPELQLWDGAVTETKDFIHNFLSSINENTTHSYFPPEIFPEPEKMSGNHGVELEVYDFLRAIKEGRPPELDGNDGLAAQAVPIAFFESNLSGQVVKIEDVLSGKIDAYQREINDNWHI